MKNMKPYPYKDYSEYMCEKFGNVKVQKISVNAGFTCPNRNGDLSKGGCIYCDNTSFTPSYCFDSKDIVKQLEAGKIFFSKKYPKMKYLAYFQSYSNTYDKTVEELESLYRSALQVEDVIGIIIGTRPDCLPENVVEMLGRIAKDTTLFVELGAETAHNNTLELINRGHTWEQTQDAAYRLSKQGIAVGLHLIAGLPGEGEAEVLDTIQQALQLPIESIKLHHLQVLRRTPLHRMIEQGEISVQHFSMEEYMDICIKIINLVDRKVAIERFLASSPPAQVVSPHWGVKNYEFVNLLRNRLNKLI